MQRQLVRSAKEFDHLSVQAQVKASAKRLKALQDTFREVANAIPEIRVVEDLPLLRDRRNRKIAALQDHILFIETTETKAVKQEVQVVRRQLEEFNAKHRVPHKRLAALERLNSRQKVVEAKFRK